MLNAETIQENFNLFRTSLTTSPGTGEEIVLFDEEPAVNEQQPASLTQEITVQTELRNANDTEGSITGGTQETSLNDAAPPSERTGSQLQTPVRTRETTIYFTLVSGDGQILQSKVTRRIPESGSPMMDALNVMLAGPSAEEITRGIINLIPQNTRVLSAMVRGNTAYLNFSEDFQFNTFGVEGYIAQLRQIVWTVTEFSNINDAQILIDGRRIDYLAEGIWIGSPISRMSF